MDAILVFSQWMDVIYVTLLLFAFLAFKNIILIQVLTVAKLVGQLVQVVMPAILAIIASLAIIIII
jgi:hypothetical protein